MVSTLPTSRRRLFRILNTTFLIPSDFQAALGNMMDGFFYALGIVLILFASVIISGLTYCFFCVMLPMIQRANVNSPYYVFLHIAFVLYILVNVLTNYYWCIITKHKGPLYDTVVRELAETTGFVYPESPVQVIQYKKEFEEKLIFRLQRQYARRREAAAATVQDTNGAGVGITQRKSTGVDSTTNHANLPSSPPMSDAENSTNIPVRRWLILGPHEWGFCDASNEPKPPRAHYDQVTRQLVLNMDHYCPWMFNTVGYFNYRYFCNFLFFTFMGMAYGAVLTWNPFWALHGKEFRQQIRLSKEQNATKTLHLFDYVPTPNERQAISFSFILCMSVGIAVLMLGGMHLYLLLTGQTTIELHGNCANRRRARRLRQKFQNPYDLGLKRNFQQVYGTGNPLWAVLIPSRRQPEFLPLPLPGITGLRPAYRVTKDVDKSTMAPNLV
jgi:palmitoyltransferase